MRVVFHSAPPEHGIQFCRVDLPHRPCIKADVSNMVDLEKRPRRTSLKNGEAEVQTVEHLMATLYALEIDNLLVEIDGVELPGLDGSAIGFYEALQKAGIQTQEAPRYSFRVREPIWVEEKGATLAVIPADELRISYILSYDHPLLRSQCFEYVSNGNNFMSELAPSRTFVLQKEAEVMRRQGLGLGATYANTLVVGEKGVIQNQLRFDNEFARHKVLDLVGDLYLTGYPLKGHVIAFRSGHPLNMRLLEKIKQQESSMFIGGFLAKEYLPMAALDPEQVLRILPHRDPFLFVDEILHFEEGKRAVGVKKCRAEESHFKGHFPNRPIMPGVLILEAMAQVAGVLVLNKKEHLGKYAYFIALDNVRFRKTVLPGDTLVLDIQMTRYRAKTGQVRATAHVNDKMVAEADMMFAIVDP